ncbi:MAG: hypothetical protein QW840_02235 [Candidatus Bathyarchaeia archaeon]
MFQIIISITALVLWTAFVAYTTWFFTSAKHAFPVSSEEARILWKIHRKHNHCNSKRWRKIKFKGKIVGFECGCGYKHVQKRPIAMGTPTMQVSQKPYSHANADKRATLFEENKEKEYIS